MESDKEHYSVIREASRNGKLSIFVGSAISYDSGLPSWASLIEDMAKAIPGVSSSNYLQVAEHYYLQFGRNTYLRKINDSFSKSAIPNAIHRKIFKLSPSTIITTNWDTLIEDAAHDSGEIYYKVVDDESLSSSPSSRLIVKMHGDLTASNFVFRESDYLQYSDNFPLIENYVKSVFSTNVVVFIGYSLSDYNLNLILEWVRKRTSSAPPVYTIIPGEEIPHYQRIYLNRKGVFPISIKEAGASPEFVGLSEKSKQVGRFLDLVSSADSLNRYQWLLKLEDTCSDWNVINYNSIVKFVRSSWGITKHNKFAFDPSTNVLIYSLDKEDFRYFKGKVFSCLRVAKRIINKTTIDRIKIRYGKKTILLNNKKKWIIEDKYLYFKKSHVNFENIGDLNEKELFKIAFDYCFIKEIGKAIGLYENLSNAFFGMSNFVRSALSSYNAYHCHKIGMSYTEYEKIGHKFIEYQNEAVGPITDKIEKSLQFVDPKQRLLFYGVDESDSYIKERLLSAYDDYMKVVSEVESRSKGGIHYNNLPYVIWKKTEAENFYFLKNKLSTYFSGDLLKLNCLNFKSLLLLSSYHDFTFDVFFIYTAIRSFDRKELRKFLSEKINKDKCVPVEDNVSEYLISILQEIEPSASFSRSSLDGYFENVWANSIEILSYLNLSDGQMKEIFSRLSFVIVKSDNTDNARSINHFIVNQYNRYKRCFSREDLSKLIDLQLEKVLSYEVYSEYQDSGKGIFRNSLLIASDEFYESENIIVESAAVDRFFERIESAKNEERLSLSSNYLMLIYQLSKGKYKKRSSKILREIFNDTVSIELSIPEVVFCLNIYIIGLYSSKEKLKILIKAVDAICDKNENSNSHSMSLDTVVEQLSKLSENGFNIVDPTLKRLTRLSSAISIF